jgi:hypothetical protein
VDEKAEEIRDRHRGVGIGVAAIWAGVAVVAAAGLVMAVERAGYLRRSVAGRYDLGDNPYTTLKERSRENRKRRESDHLAPLGGI